MRHITLKLIEHWLVYTLNSPFISLISIALNATGPLYNRKHQSHEAQTHAINNQLGTILSRSCYSDVINSVWFLIVWKTHDLYTTSYNNYSEQEGTNVFQKCTCIVCVYRNFPLKSHSNCSYYSSIVFFVYIIFMFYLKALLYVCRIEQVSTLYQNINLTEPRMISQFERVLISFIKEIRILNTEMEHLALAVKRYT